MEGVQDGRKDEAGRSAMKRIVTWRSKQARPSCRSSMVRRVANLATRRQAPSLSLRPPEFAAGVKQVSAVYSMAVAAGLRALLVTMY